jgi:hypothetical protein
LLPGQQQRYTSPPKHLVHFTYAHTLLEEKSYRLQHRRQYTSPRIKEGREGKEGEEGEEGKEGKEDKEGKEGEEGEEGKKGKEGKEGKKGEGKERERRRQEGRKIQIKG